MRAATDESTPLPELPAADAYGRSKQEAERLVLAAHAAGRVWASVVRPPLMYGKRDRQFVPRLGPVLERGFFPLVAGDDDPAAGPRGLGGRWRHPGRHESDRPPAASTT